MKVRESWAWVLAGSAAALGCVGCVERLISITSEPSGALVHLNDQQVGRTPLTVPFTFYGVYDVRLEVDGCKPLWTQRKAEAPWWELPGIDLVAQMTPDAKSHLRWHFELETLPTAEGVSMVSASAVVDRARQMRALIDGDDHRTASPPENDPH